VKKQKIKKNTKKGAKLPRKGFLSPFRYPGGKSWFVKTALKWLSTQSTRPKILVEPFAGGACIALASVAHNAVSHATFSEIDPDVAATWETILHGEANWLANKITSFRISRKTVKKVLARNPTTRRQRAFRCLLKNRTSRGGVITKGAGLIRKGEDGNGLSSRWYPDTLAMRIIDISALKSKLSFNHVDGFDIIRKYIRRKQAVFFVDPPYTKAASRLYSHWKIDHEKLFATLSRAKGATLMTYDDTDEIRKLAKKYGFSFKRISMHTTHHENKRELMICKSFDWLKKTFSQPK